MDNRYTILHEDFPVMDVLINDNYRIQKIAEIHNEDRFPLGIPQKNTDIYLINTWLFDRGIPGQRSGLSAILSKENVQNNGELFIKNYGLGLTDHYWIKPEKEDISWKNINFFDNDFKQIGDNIYIDIDDDKNIHTGHYLTPNKVSSGNLPKKWIIQENERYMIKGFETLNQQEPFNEKIISMYLDKLSIDHVKYDLIYIENKPYSICKNMLENNEELIPAWYIEKTVKKNNNESNFEHYIQCCKKMGLNDSIKKSFEQMILLDYLAANTDRHWSNFGIIRDTVSLKAKRLAPLFDHGAALYTKIHHLDIENENMDLKCESFNTKQSQVIKHVNDFSLLHHDEVRTLPALIKEELSKNKRVDDKRIEEISFWINRRYLDACRIDG